MQSNDTEEVQVLAFYMSKQSSSSSISSSSSPSQEGSITTTTNSSSSTSTTTSSSTFISTDSTVDSAPDAIDDASISFEKWLEEFMKHHRRARSIPTTEDYKRLLAGATHSQSKGDHVKQRWAKKMVKEQLSRSHYNSSED